MKQIDRHAPCPKIMLNFEVRASLAGRSAGRSCANWRSVATTSRLDLRDGDEANRSRKSTWTQIRAG